MLDSIIQYHWVMALYMYKQDFSLKLHIPFFAGKTKMSYKCKGSILKDYAIIYQDLKNVFRHPNLYILEYVAFHPPYGSFTKFYKISLLQIKCIEFFNSCSFLKIDSDLLGATTLLARERGAGSDER